MFVFFYFRTLFSSARWSFLALSAAGHARGPPVQFESRRASRRVLCAFKVPKSGK